MSDLDNRTRHKIVQGSVIPRPIAWITTLNDDNSINLAPFSYFNMLSPTMLSVSILRSENKQKDTVRNILRTKEAVIQIPDRSLLEKMDLSSKPLEKNESEIILTGLETTASKLVKTPGLKNAKIRLETKFESHLPIADFEGDNVEADLVLLRVIAAQLHESVFDSEKNYILHNELKPLARLAGPNYAEIKHIADFKRQF